MTRSTMVVCLAAVAMGPACGGDDGEAPQLKGELDTGMLVLGVEVSLQGQVGEVEVAFDPEIPELSDDDFEEAFDDSVSLLITSDENGAAADIMAGSLVSGQPSSPGDYTVELESDNERLVLSFFNESPGGFTLESGKTYTTQLAVAPNAYVETVPPVSFRVTVAN